MSFIGRFSLFPGERREHPDLVEDLAVPRAQGERQQHPQGRRRGAPLPRRAGEVPHHGRVQEEAGRLPQVHREDVGHLRHQLQGALGS